MRVLIAVLSLACLAAAQRINFNVNERGGRCISRTFDVVPKNDFLPDPEVIQLALDDAVGQGEAARNVEGYGTFSPTATLGQPEFTFNARERVLRRLTKPKYEDGLDAPRGTCLEGQLCIDPQANQKANGEFVGSNLPNPRLISDVISTSGGVIPSVRNLHDLTAHWGQMLAHDTTLVPEDASEEAILNIAIPELDTIFDQQGTGMEFMQFNRAHREERCSGANPRGTLLSDEQSIPREMNNEISSIIDGTMVYGGIGGRQNLLRAGEDAPGELNVSAGNLLPFNDLPLNEFTAQDNPRGSLPGEQFFSGDVRTFEAPGLTLLITVLVREHNRLARQHVRKLKKLYKPIDSDVVFAHAKKMLIAEIQAVSYNEWLPALYGEPFKTYSGYKPSAVADLFHEFSAATRRFGHSLINGFLPIVGGKNDLKDVDRAELSDHLFNNFPLINSNDGGIDPLLNGILCIRSQKLDHIVTPALQQRLFPAEPDMPNRDLVALNIMRGRDHGIADYNSVRVALGLPALSLFREINPNNLTLGRLMAQVYGDINRVDLFIGAIAETPAAVRKTFKGKHQTGFAEFGETLRAMFDLQFSNIRDGDRFFFERILTKKEISKLPTLSDIIRFNSRAPRRLLARRNNNIFFHPLFCRIVRDFQCVRRIRRLRDRGCDRVYDVIPELADSGSP